ncbi:uncharacterized protein EKO05_0011114 [Ascochyta rabiei]|uniref:Zinc ion binding n=1 Tax=Didymella rabiei TaxID=5454 RepID=A0A163A980_DIDRA|nr:uncharacterized protein EKO05_0011114 [Ascochyta rabiei]KZM21056.1 zinc ion binding [Ascochyta rabiei]UPX20901.1 hypothetical protein EKO05_0011114 [Ascochyta rabiei]
MDIPRGHAMLPLNESDFLDFIFNYFKAEYAPIRSFWSTATADPRQPQRWVNMGHELQPLSIRPANAQAQKDLESLDYFTRRWNLDSGFVRGLVVRFAKYEVHERLEKKLYECARLDLMVRKSLKEKHLIDALWPSPAPRSAPHELLAQGVQVRRWYGDMFAKYFSVLHSVEDFELRPEVDLRYKSGTLMLVPFVDHLVIGDVQPITPIIARGSGYVSKKPLDSRGSSRTDGYGEPDQFEVRFNAPVQLDETYTKSVVRQCQCMKCGTKRDVQVVVSVDPNPNGGANAGASASKQSIAANTAVQRRLKATERHEHRQEEIAPPQPPRPQTRTQPQPDQRPSTPEQKKQCPRCTFLNHASLTECEMCQADLPSTTITKPQSPVTPRVSHSHSASLPPPITAPNRLKAEERPGPPNRHSLSSTLFSIFPFSQQHQQEHHAKLPATQQTDVAVATSSIEPSRPEPQRAVKQQSKRSRDSEPKYRADPAISSSAAGPAPTVQVTNAPTVTPPPRPESPKPHLTDAMPEPPLSRPPEMAMMPLTPPPASSQHQRQVPVGLPSHLMDEYVPASPSFPASDEEEDAGWGDLRRKESNRAREESDDEGDEEDKAALVDLDAVAREEMGVWGEREDE